MLEHESVFINRAVHILFIHNFSYGGMRIGKDCAFHLLNVILFGLPNRGASLTNPRYNINTSVAAKPRWSTFGSARTFWTGV